MYDRANEVLNSRLEQINESIRRKSLLFMRLRKFDDCLLAATKNYDSMTTAK